MPVEIGQRIGDYQVLDLLGAGGMGQVYRVRNVISDRIEAMKILLPNLTSEPELAARFTAEIRTLASFDHPNIAQLRTAFQYGNQLVMVMEFVEGTTLEQRAQQGRLSLDEILDYFSQTLAALSYAHSRGVVHRDIKPANMMATSHGIIKLMDFGIAKSTTDLQLTRPGTTMGSLYYMSPEQVRGHTVDARSDLYSVGITLYELSTGSRPFQADTAYAVLDQQLNSPPRPPLELNPNLPRALNDIILTALAKDPARRFQSADAFRNALRTLSTAATAAAASPLQQPVPEWNSVPSPAAATPAPTFAPASPGPTPGPTSGPVSEAAFASPSPQPYTPVAPTPAAQTPAAGTKGHRGLWMGLGATAALITLIVAATFIPGFVRTRAGSQSPTQTPAQTPVQTPGLQTRPPTPTAPAQAPDSAPGATNQSNPTPPMGHAGGAASARDSTSARDTAKDLKSGNIAKGNSAKAPAETANGSASAAQGSASGPPPQQPTGASQKAGPSQKQIDAASERLTLLSARADVAQTSIQQLRQQQESAGLGLRGDIAASLSRMSSYMQNANADVNSGDIAAANTDMDKAEKELTRLEAFLGG